MHIIVIKQTNIHFNDNNRYMGMLVCIHRHIHWTWSPTGPIYSNFSPHCYRDRMQVWMRACMHMFNCSYGVPHFYGHSFVVASHISCDSFLSNFQSFSILDFPILIIEWWIGWCGSYLLLLLLHSVHGLNTHGVHAYIWKALSWH